jgi:acyl dehydratase
MGLALGPLTNWLAGRGVVTSYQVRFTKPVYVPATGAVELTVVAAVSKLDEPLQGNMTVALSVTIGEGTSVLGKALAVVAPS